MKTFNTIITQKYRALPAFDVITTLVPFEKRDLLSLKFNMKFERYAEADGETTSGSMSSNII